MVFNERWSLNTGGLVTPVVLQEELTGSGETVLAVDLTIYSMT